MTKNPNAKNRDIKMVVSEKEKEKYKNEARMMNLNESALTKLYFKIGRALIFKQSGVNLENGIPKEKMSYVVSSIKSWMWSIINLSELSKEEFEELQSYINQIGIRE